jgi:pimeloyl-ACP methyl ester carboxylesterase
MVPLLLMLPTIVRLSQLMPVIAWEPRGFTDPTSTFDAASHSVECYARDVEEVAAAQGLDLIHLVAWCAGTDVAAQVVHRHMLKIGTVALIAPALPAESPKNDLREVFGRMLSELGDAGEKEGGAILRRMQMLLKLSMASDPVDAVAQRLSTLNLATLDRARRLIETIKAFFSELNGERRRALFQELRRNVPTHAVCFEDDDVVGCPLEFFEPADANMTFDVHPTGGRGHSASFKVPDTVYSSLLRFYRARGVVPF